MARNDGGTPGIPRVDGCFPSTDEAALMSIVGLLAALGPARRALRIPASEALRADA